MAQEKLSGMEMMMNSLLRAAGFDPTELRENITQGITGFQTAIKALQSRLDQIDARLERIENHLEISAGSADNERPRLHAVKDQ